MAAYLIDTNVLLRLVDGASADQEVASRALERLLLRGLPRPSVSGRMERSRYAHGSFAPCSLDL